MTFLTGKALPRRTVLRGLGASLSLPLLDAMLPAFASRAQSPPRPFPHLTPPVPEPPPEPPPAATSTEPAFEPEQRNVIADLFQLFLEVEQGRREAASVDIPEEIARLRRRHKIE